jgi:hypothetical protein
MAVSNITVKGLTPILSILGNYQRFTFDDPFSSFQKDALFVPTLGNPSQTNDEHRNTSLSGYRWYHRTLNTDTIGTYTLQSFLNGAPTGTDLMRVNQNNTIDFLVPTSLSGFSITANLDLAGFKIVNLGTPTLPTDAVTKAYADSLVAGSITLTGAVTGSGTGTINTTLTPITTALITNFNTEVAAFRLDQFTAPNTVVSMGNNKITNLAVPTLATDATNKSYVDAKTWTTSAITDFITSVTAFRLDQFAAPISSLSMGSQKITNLATPTLATDAVTKAYADSLVGGASITLTGAVTGSGSGTIVTTLTDITTAQITNFNSAVTAFRLDQFTAPTGSVGFGNQKLINILTPTLATDAATKGYVDAKTWTSSAITDFTSAVTAFRLDQFALPISSLNVNSQKIINLGVPTLGTDATNKNYVDGKTITLTGAVTGSGVLGNIVTTLTNILTSQITNFNAAVTAFRLDQFAVPTSAVSMNGQKITNLATPTISTDAVTKAYADSLVAGASITLTGAVTGSGTGTVATILTPITTSQITNFNAAVTAFRLDQFAIPTADINLNSHKIINVLNPTNAQDASTKSYTDTAASNAQNGATTFAFNYTNKYQNAASLYYSNNALTNVLLANVPQKINGVTNSTTNGFTVPIGINNRATSASNALFFHCYGTVQLLSSVAGTNNISLQIVKNGVVGVIVPFMAGRVITANVPQMFTIHSAPFQMVIGDFVELFITATSACTVTVQNMVYNIKTIMN